MTGGMEASRGLQDMALDHGFFLTAIIDLGLTNELECSSIAEVD